MPKQLMWLAVTPDEFEQVIFAEETAKALAHDLGVNPQTVRRQKWYAEHKSKKKSPYKYKIVTYEEKL